MRSQPVEISLPIASLRQELEGAEARVMMALAIDNTAKAEREDGHMRARVRELSDRIRSAEAR